jgi:hypothetical protein
LRDIIKKQIKPIPAIILVVLAGFWSACVQDEVVSTLVPDPTPVVLATP